MANEGDAIGSIIERATESAGAGRDTGEPWSTDHVRQIEELRHAVADLKDSVSRMPRVETVSASDAFDDGVREVEETLTRNMFASVGIAAFVGYVWGRLR